MEKLSKDAVHLYNYLYERSHDYDYMRILSRAHSNHSNFALFTDFNHSTKVCFYKHAIRRILAKDHCLGYLSKPTVDINQIARILKYEILTYKTLRQKSYE